MNLTVRNRAIGVNQFASRYELEPIVIDEDTSFVFVIDVYKKLSNGLYFPKVYKKEYFSLTSSFSKDKSGMPISSDEELAVDEHSENWENIEMPGEKDVLEFVLNKLKDIFD